MNESLVKYLAGLLDADGSFSLTFNPDNNRPGLNFVGVALKLSSSEAVDKSGFVLSLPELTGMGSAYRERKNLQIVDWMVSKRAHIEMLLPRVIKHMVIKAKHWEWVLSQWREVRGGTVSDCEKETIKQAAKSSRVVNSGPLKPKNHPTWAWLAGYLDGDGWYCNRLYRGHTHIHVGAVAHQNDIHVLDFIHRSFGGAIYRHGQAAQVWVWRRSLGTKNRSFALSFLPNLAKHSRLKRHKIEAIIHNHRQRLSDQGATA